ncbi:MAG: efflux RND transporter periplasmic adaptor subunit [Ignavibacteriaceae bacterium]
MKIQNLIIGVLVLIIAAVTYLWLGSSGSSNSVNTMNNNSKQTAQKERKIIYWRAPMNPSEVYNHPGKSKMGMDLVPVYEDEASGNGIVTINGAVQQNMNVKISAVEDKDLSSRVITNGILTIDERKEYMVTTRVSGWIQKLYVNYTGQVVNKGDKLMDIYSPELVAAEQELLTALSYQSAVKNSTISEAAASGSELLKNAVEKLKLLEIPQSEIERIKETKNVKTYMTLYAQNSGTVIAKNVVEGQKVMAGTPLLHIANLTNLWLTADIYEYELPKVRLGSPADINFNFFPGKTFKSRVSFIYPTLDDKTRTVKIRFDIPNYNNELKPSMFANIVISGRSLGNYPVVPEQAVIRSGQKNIVILAMGNGRFKPVEVTLGDNSEGYYQVLKGLSAGDNIVTSAQFLIDSESNLQAAVSQFSSQSPNDTAGSMKNMDMELNQKLKAKSQTKKNESEIIRKEPIDVESIDKNKDGKLYEDIMDWNVISDKPGICPLCGMTLREFTIKEVKENLAKHGLKYKD